MCVHVLTRGTLVFISVVELWLIIPEFLLYFLCKFVLKDVLEHSIFTNEGDSLLRNSCFLRRVLTRPSPSQAPTLVWMSHTNSPENIYLGLSQWEAPFFPSEVYWQLFSCFSEQHWCPQLYWEQSCPWVLSFLTPALLMSLACLPEFLLSHFILICEIRWCDVYTPMMFQMISEVNCEEVVLLSCTVDTVEWQVPGKYLLSLIPPLRGSFWCLSDLRWVCSQLFGI